MTPHIFFTDRHTQINDHIPAGISVSRMHQCHSNHISVISPSGHLNYAPNTDAIVTQKIKHALIVRTADCLPLLIYAAPNTIAAIHAGRAGTLANITGLTIQKIIDMNTASIQKWIFWLGPHICEVCYEIDPITHLKYSLKNENIKQIKALIPSANVKIMTHKACTSCQNETYFSYRKNNTYSGRFFSGIFLR